jgi:hypothetical protein
LKGREGKGRGRKQVSIQRSAYLVSHNLSQEELAETDMHCPGIMQTEKLENEKDGHERDDDRPKASMMKTEGTLIMIVGSTAKG